MAQRELLDFFERHAGSQTPYLTEARAALQEDDCESSAASSTVECTELLSTYTFRAEHLKGIRTAHAVQLQSEVTELCVALERASGHAARFFSATLRGGLSFLFLEDATTMEILGALASHDARKLSDDDRQRVWGPPRASEIPR
jgi:reverse gyrase